MTNVDPTTTDTTNVPDGETPPPPEDEGFRERVMEEERERKLRAAEAFDERSQEAKKLYTGVNELGDQPGSALPERDQQRDEARQP